MASGTFYTYYPDYYEVSSLPVPGQPPLAVADKYFYGAQRFIARKPDKLVIADDGGYVLDDEHRTPKKRVVTIDLQEASMSVTDVNVEFTTKFSQSTKAYCEPTN